MKNRRWRTTQTIVGILIINAALSPSIARGDTQQQVARVTTTIAHYLRGNTTLPIYGPAFVPTDPKVGANVEVTKTSYEATLIFTDGPLPINSPKLNATKYAAMGALLGSFGAKEYRSKSAAAHTVDLMLSKNSGQITKDSIGDGITADVWNSVSEDGTPGLEMLTWHEQGWTFQFTEGSPNYDIQMAKTMVAYLAKHHVPHGTGAFTVMIAPDGEHTYASWRNGLVVMNCNDDHDALEDLKMVVSERTFPS